MRKESGFTLRLAGLLLLSAMMAAFMLCPITTAQETGEEDGLHTGPIDPAAGSWILYRGERAAPDQPAPQPFHLRITYGFPSGTPQEGTILEAEVEELDAEQHPVSSRSFFLHTKDRFYQDMEGGEDGFWPYWLTPRLEEGDAATIRSDLNLQAGEATDYEYKEDKYRVVSMQGDGMELLVEERTGLVFRISKEDGERLEIEDTNMLAQYPLWGYYPDNKEVGDRLGDLANSHHDLVEVSSLGKSMKGRDIWLAHITDFTSTETKRSILLGAAFEGDSPEGSDFLLDLLEEMAARAQEDEELAGLLELLDIYAVPVVNPDGLQRWLAMPDPLESPELYSQAPRNGNLVFLNHNFDIKWGEGDRDPASAGYAGGEPFSETESQAVSDLLDDVPFSLYVDIHSGTGSLIAPWNWNSNPSSNPEKDLYEHILSEISEVFPFPVRAGIPAQPFPGSSTDWAYEGNGASSPLCLNMYLEKLNIGDTGEGEAQTDLAELEDHGSLSVYSPCRQVIQLLMENLHSYLAVDIITGDYNAEVNVPLDVEVEVVISGMRALPNAEARLVLTNGSGLKLATLSEKDVGLGDLEPGSSANVSWNLEGKARGTYVVEVVINSSYPEYDHIPGTYSTQVEITISTQRTWLVLVLLTLLVLFVLGLIFLSMRKHHRKE